MSYMLEIDEAERTALYRVMDKLCETIEEQLRARRFSRDDVADMEEFTDTMRRLLDKLIHIDWIH
jgi:hypothetical protein